MEQFGNVIGHAPPPPTLPPQNFEFLHIHTLSPPLSHQTHRYTVPVQLQFKYGAGGSKKPKTKKRPQKRVEQVG